MFQLRFSPKLISETVYFPYLPLNKSGRIQNVLERSKLEYVTTKSCKFGGGYGGYHFADGNWQHKPFFTTTFTGKLGAFGAWLQKVPGGA